MSTQQRQGAEPAPARRRWRRRAGLTVVVLLGLGMAFCAWRWHKMGAALRQDVADLDRGEPGWRLHEIEAARTEVPDEENGALCVLRVAELLPRRWWGNERVEALRDVSPNEQFTAREFALLRADMDLIEPALAEARKLAHLPRGRFPITYATDPLATDLSHHIAVSRVHGFVRFAAWRGAQAGDLRGAATFCRAQVNAARALGDEPLALSQSIRSVDVSLACDTVARTLAQGEPEPDDLKGLQELLEDEDRHPGWLIAMRGERAEMHQWLTGLEGGAIDLNKYGRATRSQRLKMYFRDDLRAEHRRLFPWAGRLIAAAQLPPHLRRQEMDAFYQELCGAPRRAGGRGITNLNGFGPTPARDGVLNLLRLEADLCAHQARLRCMVVALAAERYRRLHGRWPEALDRLTPGLLAAVPADPFDGEPLRCAHVGDGLVVYSVGCDGKDDGGALAASSPWNQDGDLGFRLWDVQHRRRPPQPR